MTERITKKTTKRARKHVENYLQLHSNRKVENPTVASKRISDFTGTVYGEKKKPPLLNCRKIVKNKYFPKIL